MENLLELFFIHEWWISEWNKIHVLPEYQRAYGTFIIVKMAFWWFRLLNNHFRHGHRI
jgi:hypothetical protein